MHWIWSLFFIANAHASPDGADFGVSFCASVNAPVRADIARALSPSDFAGAEAQIDAAITEARAIAPEKDLCRDEKALTKFSFIMNQVVSAAGRIDIAFFNQSDYWQTTHETLQKKYELGRYGDCEDIAILKYWTLRRAGCSADGMHIAVLSGMGKQPDHAVLVVKTASSVLVLDSIAAQNGRPYLETPYFSSMNLVYLINEEKVKYICPKDSQFRVLK